MSEVRSFSGISSSPTLKIDIELVCEDKAQESYLNRCELDLFSETKDIPREN